jgi:hypothetical protein
MPLIKLSSPAVRLAMLQPGSVHVQKRRQITLSSRKLLLGFLERLLPPTALGEAHTTKPLTSKGFIGASPNKQIVQVITNQLTSGATS